MSLIWKSIKNIQEKRINVSLWVFNKAYYNICIYVKGFNINFLHALFEPWVFSIDFS
jgi:hypothetical protein